MSHQTPPTFVNVNLDLELWGILRKYSYFFEGQAEFLETAGKPLPERYQFGVPHRLSKPKETFENLIQGLSEKPGFRILNLAYFLDLCEYLLIDELTIIGLIYAARSAGIAPP